LERWALRIDERSQAGVQSDLAGLGPFGLGRIDSEHRRHCCHTAAAGLGRNILVDLVGC